MSNEKKPIAIVGIGCRFPGSSSSPSKFWEMLVDETDAIVNVPADRWDNRRFYDDNDNKTGKLRALQGGFLTENIGEFDPMFFGISPREAEPLDPQTRLLLEVAYEAIEDSGSTLEALKGSRTGVFVGAFTFDNYGLQTSKSNRDLINSHTATGATMTMYSNRLSYTFDLRGPSLSIDTACSSSLVSTHYACQSIWNGESAMALAGGVNLMLRAENSILMSKGKFLSRHSRCKAFDSDAGGYVRGEGAGIVLLKPLDKALEDNDRIYALIKGTGANQDGHTNGITVPNGASQKELIKEIYASCNVNPAQVRYVEAHGTGTPVGDPIEFGALNEALSVNRKEDDKCLIGSVKTNMGHLEAGAGVAGLIKAALCLHHNKVPANLHFNNPNPALNYEKSILKVPVTLENLPDSKDSLASVNSFGYGGTNAHAVLMQYPGSTENEVSEMDKKDMFIFPLSAESEAALKEMVVKFREYLEDTTDSFARILSNVVYRRTHHTERLATAATSKDDLINKLEAWEEDIQLKGVARGSEVNEEPKVVFVYTGMGPQWWKMGRELLESEPVFYSALAECDKEFKAISGWSVLEEMKKPEESSRIKDTNIAQPANLLIQVGLTKLLEHYGISPDAVVGHSVGEVASQYVAGALSLQAALKISYHRSRLQHKTSGMGSMLAVGLPEGKVSEALGNYKNISVAAVNSPGSVTLAGDTTELKKLAAEYEAQGIFNRMLEVTVPYHSPVMHEIEDELLEALADIKGATTSIDLYSTVTGDIIDGEEIDNNYWWRNVRETVRFSKAIDAITRDSYNIYIEIGPHPVLRNSMIECVQNNQKFHFVQTLNRKEPEQINFFENLAALYTLGCPVNWSRWVSKLPHLTLPAYPWQREYFWMESRSSMEDRLGRQGSVYLNNQVYAPQPTYETELNKYFFPFLNDHIVHGKVVFPGAGYVAAAMALYQQEISQNAPFGLENIRFHQVLALDNNKVQRLYTSFNSENRHYSVQTRDEGENSSWFIRSTGKFIIGKYESEPAVIDINAIRSRMDRDISEEEIYERLSHSKLEYGPWFRTIKGIQIGDGELLAKIEGHADLDINDGHFFHPTLLDACFQSMIVFDSSEFVPVSIGKLHCHAKPGKEFYCYSRLKYTTANSAIADLIICDEQGRVAVEIEDFKCQELVSHAPQSTDFLKDSLFNMEWAEVENPTEVQPVQSGVTCIFAYDYALCESLVKELHGRIVIFQVGTTFRELGDDHYEFNTDEPETLARVLSNLEDVQVISLLSIDEGDESKSVSERCLDKIMPHLNILRYFRNNASGKLKIAFVTQGSQAVLEGDVVNSAVEGAIHGLARLVSNEISNCEVSLADLPGKAGEKVDESVWKTVAAKFIGGNTAFEEFAVRNGRVFIKSVRKCFDNQEDMVLEKLPFHDRPLRLEVAHFGNLDDLRFGHMERIAPKAGELEISIDNTSINYKDYLKVCGKISAEALEGTYCEEKIGLDCAGVILSVGEGVTGFSVGDRVIAFAAGTYQSNTTTSAKLAVKCPDVLQEAESAIITSYVTAVYSLRDKAALSSGDKVLIHNATGGVGLAAINYARLAGAEIFATAGTEEKREYLRSIGISNVYSSRNLDFSREIMKATGSYGVDVVLSSLPGEMMYQSLAILAPYGTYLEIGKKDIVDNASLPMRFFNKNLSYISIDLDRMLRERQDKMNSLLGDVCDYIQKGQLQPLPVKIFTAAELSDAFRLVEESKHIGKVIIDFKGQVVEVAAQRQRVVKADSTYLITGGTKGLGLEIARWLVANGAENLALVSRSGLRDRQAQIVVEEMIRNGVNVKVYAVDIADKVQVGAMFDQMKKELPQLGGIFHGAMVLDDGYLMDMNEQRFNNVLRPKVDGAMNLHNATKEIPLDYFVMFSSISSLIGNVGQANYVSANAFLDAFAWYRHGLGLPATTINLGVLAESGVVARNKNLETVLEGAGIRSFTNEQVMAGLNSILLERPVQTGFFDLNWKMLKNIGQSGVSLFRELIEANATSNDSLTEKQAAHLNNIKVLGGLERHAYVVDLLTAELARILKMSADQVSPDKGINFLGIDSILSVELIRRINDELAIEMSPMEFLAGPSVSQLATSITERLVQDQETELV